MRRKTFIPPLMPDERLKLDRLHKRNIKNAHSLIDFKPPRMMASSYFRVDKLKEDYRSQRRICNFNVRLLAKINDINRSHGYVDHLNKFQGIASNRVQRLQRKIRSIEKRNRIWGAKLLKIKSLVDNRKDVIDRRAEHIKNKRALFIPSGETVWQYMQVLDYRDAELMAKLLRPKIYMDLSVKNVRPLGRLTIQLFTEACPEFVLEFVRLCSHNNRNALKVIRIFSQLWMEGELLVNNDVLRCPDFLYEMLPPHSGFDRGILSFGKCYLDGFPEGILNFTISFKKILVLHEDRIPFGWVCNGLKILDLLPDYGTKNGKTKKEIEVVQCGLL